MSKKRYMNLFYRIAALAVFLTSFTFISAESKEFCEIYPITVPADLIANSAPGTVFDSIPLGTDQGNWGWLTWNGAHDPNTLAKSLMPPGTSSDYINPDNPFDQLMEEGDWVQGLAEVECSGFVRSNLDALIGRDITIPVWSNRLDTDGSGSNYNHQIHRFAIIEITGYYLGRSQWMSFVFKGYTNCYNAPPIANNASYELPENTSLNIDVVASDADADTLAYQIIQTTQNGTLTGTGPNYTYTPAANFSGTDSFTFKVNDGEEDSNIATVTIQVNPVNNAPTAQEQNLETNEDQPLTLTLTGTDSENSVLTFSVKSQVSSGTLAGTGANLTYTPGPDFNGQDSFTFLVQDAESLESNIATVTITVNPVNDAPAADNINLETFENNAASLILKGSDIDGDSLSYIQLTLPEHGQLSGTGAGLVYTPNPGYFGPDTFTYQVNDGSLDSNTATVAIFVKETNKPPEIVTIPTLQGAQDTAFEYDVDATDPNGNDILSYTFTDAPDGAIINSVTGLIQWTPQAEFVAHNTANNTYCALSEVVDKSRARIADIVLVVDESGSMSGEHQWMAELAPLLDAHLRANDIGDDTEINKFGLVGYGNSARIPRQINVGGEALGSSDALIEASKTLQLNGGTEDGWAGLNFAAQYPLRTNSSRNMILVTDEDRNNIDNSITFETLKATLEAQNVILNVAVNAKFRCADGRDALGLGQDKIGYVADGSGGFTICSDARVISDAGTTNENYVLLALALKGAAWDLNVLRGGGINAQSFSSAFIEIKVDEIKKQFKAIEQPDLVLAELSSLNETVSVTVKNRGLVDITGDVDVNLKDSSSTLGSLTLTNLAAGESKTLTHSLSSVPDGGLSAEVSPRDSSLKECFTDNNTLQAGFINVTALDTEGLSDSQNFSFTVADKNEAPSLTSTAPTSAPVDTLYEYQVTATDPDSGDGLHYTLVEAPTGMSIDNINGLVSFRPNGGQIGGHMVVVQVSDLAGLSHSQSFSITVDGSYNPPKFTSTPVIRAIVETQYVYQPVVKSDSNAKLSYRLFRGPEGIQMDPSTGLLQWTVPASVQGQKFPVIIEVHDENGNYDLQSYSIIGDIPPSAPTISKSAFSVATQGGNLSKNLSASDSNHVETLAWELVNAPAGAVFKPISGRTDQITFNWNPSNNTNSGNLSDFNTHCRIPGSLSEKLEVQTQWISTQRIIQPLLGPLYDSNQDGKLDLNDRMALVGVNYSGQVVALDANTGKLIWSRTDLSADRAQVAALVNLDGDNTAEVVFVQTSGKLVALNADGSSRWISTVNVADGSYYQNAVYPTDLNGDGKTELLFGPSVFDGENGKLLWSFPLKADTHTYAARGNAIAVDLDKDGNKEVLYYNEVRDWQGKLLWKTPGNTARRVYMSYFASGNFDSDPEPEIVVSEYSNYGYWLRLFEPDGTLLWEKKISSYGSLVVADFNRDLKSEIYSIKSDALYDGNGDLVWQGSNTTSYFGASAADVDADGYLDIIRKLTTGYIIVQDGLTGQVSHKIPHAANAQTPQATPYFADINGDGAGEIIAGSSSYVSVFKSSGANWLPGTRIYAHLQQNKGAFNSNLTPPKNPDMSSFGQTGDAASLVQSAGRLADPLINYVRAYQSGTNWRIDGVLANRGTAHMPAGTIVEIYADNPADEAKKIAEITLGAVKSGASSSFTTNVNSADLLGAEIFAKIKTDPALQECSVDNNIASAKVLRVSVSDRDGLSDTAAWALGAYEKSNTPALKFGTISGAQEMVPFQFQISATDTNLTDVLRYYFTNAPPGATLDSVTGLMKWTPAYGQAGSHRIYVKAVDLSNKSHSSSFIVSVASSSKTNSPPAITSTGPATASTGYAYRYDVKANDPDGEQLTYSLAGTIPEGMTISSLTGRLDWNPTIVHIGDVEVSVKATDERGLSDVQVYTLKVRSNAPPTISSTPGGSITAGSTYIYDTNASDPDDDEIIFSLTEAPTGMSIDGVTGLIQWATVKANVGEYQVKVRAADIFGAYQEQTFTLNVSDISVVNVPPAITSTPRSNAYFTKDYTYDVDAQDSDGDTLTYILTTAPGGMSIDALTGLISWTPTSEQAGSSDIVIRVEDGRGGISTQSYAVYASDGSETPNTIPEVTSQPGFTTKQALEYRYQVLATDAEGDTLTYTLLEAPTGMTIDDTGLISWTPDAETTETARVRVSDGKGYVEQGWSIEVISSSTRLTVDIGVSPRTVNEGEKLKIQVTPIDAYAPLTAVLKVDGVVVALDDSLSAEVEGKDIGQHEIEVIVTDLFETVRESDVFYVRDPGDTSAPTVELKDLTDAISLTSPTEIIATIEDPNLTEWRLIYKEKGTPDDEYIVAAQGTTSVTEQTLAVFDPTTLQNGQYAIILEANDASGNLVQTNATVVVEGDLKVGNFSVSFEDVNIPVSGIPIVVNRTYDSRQKHRDLDFGHGWSVGYQNVRVHESRDVGRGWSLNKYGSGLGVKYCVEPFGDPIVTVTLPTGRVEKFKAKASPHCQQLVPAIDVVIEMEALPGTTSTLKQNSYGLLRVVNGNLVDLGDPGQPVDPDSYQLTTADNYIYDIDQDFGIRKVTEPTGHSLSFTKSGMLHSGGQSISFVRNKEDRITAIDLPDGEQIKYEYDDEGNLIAHRDQLDAKAAFTYNQSHGLLDIIDARGVRATRNEYDNAGRLLAQIDADGNRLEFNNDVNSRRSVIKNRRGFTQVFTYDNMGNVLTETNGAGEVTTKTYDDNQNVLSSTDALGNITSWTYNSKRSRLTDTDPLGNITTYTYNDLQKLLTRTAPDGTVISTDTYNNQGEMLSSTNALGVKSDFTHGALGLTSMKDTLGSIITYSYSGDNLASQTNANGVQTKYTYDSMGRMLTKETSRTNSAGLKQTLTTSYEYDAKGNLIKRTDPLGAITLNEYNVFGKETAIVDPLGQRTEYEYDARGSLTKTRYPDGTTETKKYDEENNIVEQTDRSGRITKMVYDGANRLTQTVYPDGSKKQNIYDAAGRLSAEIDQRGNRLNYAYDAAGRRTQVQDALGNVTRTDYDLRGNRVKLTDARGGEYHYVYDASNRLLETTYPDGTKTSITYDIRGRKLSETDQAGNLKRFTYDGAGNMLTVLDALNQETSYTYDEQNSRLTQTDAEGRSTSWSYDLQGRMLSRTLPLGQSESFTYGKTGLLQSGTDFKNQTTTYTYETATSRLSGSTYEDGTAELYTYTPTGKQATAILNGKVSSYTYDQKDRLTNETQPDGTQLSYEYDAAGNRVVVTMTRGSITRVTRNSYDVLNRLKSVTDHSGNVTNYTYDQSGNRTNLTQQNGNKSNYTYDALNRLTGIVHLDGNNAVQSSFDYTLDVAGRRTRVAENNGRIITYSYDKLYRLTGESITDTLNGDYQAVYQYDKVGNRVSETVDGNQTVYSYDANDRLTAQGAVLYTYDDNGNTLTQTDNGTLTNYTYDARNKVTTMEKGGVITTYAYNTDGIRTSKTVDGVKTRFIVDGNRRHAQVLAEVAADDSIQVSYTYGQDLLSQDRSGVRSFYAYDGLGSTRALTDDSGAVTDTYNYEAFGELLNSTGATENSYLFTGEQFDAGLNQYYLRARYYQPGSGRFTQQDTFYGKGCTPITLNKYIYANSDPVGFIDPSGYFGFSMGGVMSGLGSFSLRSVGSFARFAVGGKKGKKSIVKYIGCQVGTAYLKREYAHDRVEGHHAIPKNVGGDPAQALIYLPASTHRMFHWVFHVMLKSDPELKGMGNWTSKEKWGEVSRSVAGRKRLYKHIYAAAKIVDKFCRLRKPRSLKHFVKANKKSFIGE